MKVKVSGDVVPHALLKASVLNLRLTRLSTDWTLQSGFRDDHKFGNADRGWQPPHTGNMLFLGDSLHIIALGRPNRISSLIPP